MSRIVRVKNTTIADKTWVGITIAPGAYYTIPHGDEFNWTENSSVFASVGNGNLVVNTGSDTVDDISNLAEAWNWMLGDTLPKSPLGDLLAVHPSTKPKAAGKEFYLVWTGAGDDIVNGIIGEGELLSFAIKATDTSISKDVRFDPQFGDIYLHEGYAKWNNGGIGDNMTATIMADPTVLQQSVNLDLIVDGTNWVKYAPGGAGTGTDGFAATPVLVPRTFSKDGDWDYDGVNLTPNSSGTGGYRISSVERTVHKYINRIPLCFSSGTYTRLTSDETAYLPPGYFIRITAFNVSGNAWNCSFMFEVYRERTATP